MNSVQKFDYVGIPPETVQSVRDAATRIKVRMGRTAQDIIEIGRDLIEVKKQLGHGNFNSWIESEFAMSKTMATRFMQVAENLESKYATMVFLPPNVLYALATPSTSDEVREDVLGRAAKGESVSVADIKALKEKLADKDEKLRTLRRQKESVEAYVNTQANDLRTKLSEVARFKEEADHLREELARALEPGTITVTPLGSWSGAEWTAQSTTAPINPSVDLAPWKLLIENIWVSAPPEVQECIRDFISRQPQRLL